jgi:hypothetical protein
MNRRKDPRYILAFEAAVPAYIRASKAYRSGFLDNSTNFLPAEQNNCGLPIPKGRGNRWVSGHGGGPLAVRAEVLRAEKRNFLS